MSNLIKLKSILISLRKKFVQGRYAIAKRFLYHASKFDFLPNNIVHSTTEKCPIFIYYEGDISAQVYFNDNKSVKIITMETDFVVECSAISILSTLSEIFYYKKRNYIVTIKEIESKV